MSADSDPPEQEDFEKCFTVFDGSSPEDVSHARQLWSSLSLLPPLESRLVSADIRQRLPVSRPPQPPPQRSSSAPGPRHFLPAPVPPSVEALRQRREERQRYAAMADQRREILALLRRQREQRVRKELLSAGFRPKPRVRGEKALQRHKQSEAEQLQVEVEQVEQLQ